MLPLLGDVAAKSHRRKILPMILPTWLMIARRHCLTANNPILHRSSAFR
jgi:hypothetical protein